MALIALRKREPALRRGNFAEVFSRDAMYVFLRSLGDDRILVVLNGSDKPKTFAMPISDRAWHSYQLDDLIGGGVAKLAGSDAAMKKFRRLGRGSCGHDESRLRVAPVLIWRVRVNVSQRLECREARQTKTRINIPIFRR